MVSSLQRPSRIRPRFRFFVFWLSVEACPVRRQSWIWIDLQISKANLLCSGNFPQGKAAKGQKVRLFSAKKERFLVWVSFREAAGYDESPVF